MIGVYRKRDPDGRVIREARDLFTAVVLELEPDFSNVPLTDALYEPGVLAHMARVSAVLAMVAVHLPHDNAQSLAYSLGYKWEVA